MVKHFERLHPQERKRLASEEGKIVPDVGKYLVHVEDLHRERVVPILDDKDLVLVEASKSQARGSACGGDQ
jgi:nucleoside-triphosphatase THEP1